MSRKSQTKHPRPVVGFCPDLTYIQNHIDQDVASGHWFWNTTGLLRYDNEFGDCFVRFRCKTHPTAKGRKYAEYSVIRLLCERQYSGLSALATIHNTCGLSQCVNPSHWVVTPPRLPWQLDVYADKTWQLVSTWTGQPCDKAQLINVRSAGIVHVAYIHPLFQRTNDTSFRVLCGGLIDPALTVVVDSETVITCTGGC